MTTPTMERVGNHRPAPTRSRRVSSCRQHPRYKAGCPDCQHQDRQSKQQRTQLQAAGQWDGSLTDATPARTYIDYLTSRHHMTLLAIANASGVAHNSVCLIASGNRTRAAQYTVEAICGVKPPAQPPKRMPAHGTARRLQALAHLGYNASLLARMLKTTPERVHAWRRMDRQTVPTGVHRKVAALTHHLADRPGPSDEARRAAANYRWVSLADWDNIDANPNPAVTDDTCNEYVAREAAHGRIPLDQLTAVEKQLMYRLWCQMRTERGETEGAKPFGREFGIGEWQARLIVYGPQSKKNQNSHNERKAA